MSECDCPVKLQGQKRKLFPFQLKVKVKLRKQGALTSLESRPELETANKKKAAENTRSAKYVAKMFGATSSKGFLVAIKCQPI